MEKLGENYQEKTNEPPNKRAKLDLWIYSTDDSILKTQSPQANNNNNNDEAEQSLDEGEIVDDEDILEFKDIGRRLCEETVGDTEERRIEKRTNDNEDLLPIDENISDDELSLQQEDNDDKFEEGECSEFIKNDDDNKEDIDEIGSNYSDWSESEDDLLKGDSLQPEIKSEPIDNDNESTLVKEDIDLEAISDDDFESITDDVYNKNGSEFEKLFQKESYKLPEKEMEEISILDTLKIDWESLIDKNSSNDDNYETMTKPKENKKIRSEQFRKQNSTIAMLNRVGFSQEFAGPKLTSLINEYMIRKLGDSYQPILHRMPALHTFYKNKQTQNETYLEHPMLS